jgi:hypothetical protein
VNTTSFSSGVVFGLGSGAEKEKLLDFLTQHSVPWGTENKFSNTVAFFEARRETDNQEREETQTNNLVGFEHSEFSQLRRKLSPQAS